MAKKKNESKTKEHNVCTLPGRRMESVSTAQIGQIWSRDAIKKKPAEATMLIVSINPRTSEKSIAQISSRSKRKHKRKLGNRVGDENSGELAHTIRGGGQQLRSAPLS